MHIPRHDARVTIDHLAGPLPERMAFEGVRYYGPMGWEKSLGQLCVKVSEAVTDQTLEGVYWRPGDLVRAALEGPDRDSGRLNRVQAAAKLALGMYAGLPSEEHFDDMVERFKRAKMMDKLVWHEADLEIRDNTTASSFTTSEHIRLSVENRPMLFLPVQRSVVAGMHVFLHHQQDRTDAERSGTGLYPLIRRGLLGPSMQELRMLREQSEGKTVVVFDTVANRDGTDMAYTVAYLKRELETEDVLGFVNRDHRWPGFKVIQGQGQQWERVLALPGKSSVRRELY